MFNLRKRVERIEKKLQQIEKQKESEITEVELYKFYLRKRIEEINAKLINKIEYHIRETNIPLLYTYKPGINIEIEISGKTLFNEDLLIYWLNKQDQDIRIVEYKIILEYLNKKSIGYFIKLDKKIEEIKKKKLNLEEELKKII